MENRRRGKNFTSEEIFAFSRVGWQKSISDRKYAVGAVTHKQKEAAWQKLTASHHQDADRKISIICLFYLNEI
jgi:hypothetical protein